MAPFNIILTLLSLFATSSLAISLTLTVPSNIPALHHSTHALLSAVNVTHRARITRSNSFIFDDISPPPSSLAGASSTSISYLLDIACRNYDFASYGVDVTSKNDGGGEREVVEVYRVSRGGFEFGGERVVVGNGPVEVRMLRAREYYETRGKFSPLDLLKNPMILIALVGLGFVFGMPYLLDSMDPEMKKEFEEQQKKGILGGGTNAANPLQNFDMAAWMAGKSTGTGAEVREEGSGSKIRKRT